MKIFNVLFILVITITIGCQQELVEPANSSITKHDASVSASNAAIESLTFYGPAKRLGNGSIRTYYKQTMDGTPLEIGIKITANGLQNLPAQHTDYVLTFHKKANASGYTHAFVNWNPGGHAPPGVYDVPHFDFHFYIMSNEDRLAITADDHEQFSNLPDAQYQPPLYFAIPGGEAQMGTHWIDLLAPEFNGGAFTRTFIYGSYDGKFIFYEPMITLEYLLSQPNETLEIRQPEAYQDDGYYAMNYRITYSEHPKEYTIALVDLTHHTGQ